MHAAWFTLLVRMAAVLLLDSVFSEEELRPEPDEIVLLWDRSKRVGVQYRWLWGEYTGTFLQWEGLQHGNTDALVFLSKPYSHVESLTDISEEYVAYMRRQTRKLERSLSG